MYSVKETILLVFLLSFPENAFFTLCVLANSEDLDEMQHHAAFHQGLHCLLRLKQPSGTDICHNL